MQAADFLSLLKKVKKTKTGWVALCPAHDDKKPSLSVSQADDKILIKCHVGCTCDDIINSLGIKKSDLFFGPIGDPVIVAEYRYEDEHGKHLYSSIRYHPKAFKQRSASGEWSIKSIRQVPYRLPAIIRAIKSQTTIYIVEGEKDVHSLEALGLTATTNSGGAGKWRPEFSKIFAGATEIVILPDNDAPGQKHAQEIKKTLPSAKIVNLPEIPEKGDVTDWIKAGGTAAQLRSLHTKPFRSLGHNHGSYYFFPNGSRQVIRLTAITKQNLLTIAPIEYWMANYFFGRGISWDHAINDVIRECESEGVYDVSRHRGRGAWIDSGKIVIHLGNRTLVNNIETDPGGKYVYEAGISLPYSGQSPLKKEEANNLQQIIDSLFWEKSIYGKLLAGWCVAAPICGALDYRPNVWLTGKAGAGKSYVINHIVKPCMGEFRLYAQSKTTEAGIRQSLKSDALPVMIDEFEGEDFAARERVQKILDLARQSFSESDGKIIMGSSGGDAVEYQIRSMFFMASIGVGVVRHADETRITVLSLKTPHDRDGQTAEEHFKNLRNNVTRILTPEWCSRFRARTFSMIPTIRKNAEIFSVSLARKIGNRRTGDQAGVLLAGAYSLCSDDIITQEFADKWINERDWTDQEQIAERSDEMDCLNIIMQHIVKISPSEELSVYEMIKECKKQGIIDGSHVTRLRRIGIRFDNTNIYVSNSLLPLKKIMEKSPYEKNWGRILKRIDGTEEISMRFIGNPTKTIRIPWETIEGYPEEWDNF
jgi:putative DNA primase/helicase